MIDLYAAGTSNGMRARIAIEECGLAYTLHPVNLQKGEQKSAAPWFRPRIDLPDMAQTSRDAHQKRARRGSCLSSAKG